MLALLLTRMRGTLAGTPWMAHVSRIFRSGNKGMTGMLVKARLESTSAAPKATESPADATEPIPVRYPYFVSRVGLGGMSLPVYTDIRHGGSQWITQIRKVEGDANVRAAKLTTGSLP